MTGRIEELATPEKPGRIATNSGPNRFHCYYRYETGTSAELTLGQLVSFEHEKGAPEFAVSVRPKEAVDPFSGGRKDPREIRYQGSEQNGNIRSYRFQAWRSGEENEEAIISIDLAMFRRHGIAIQEGPGICLRLLEAEFQEFGLVCGTDRVRTLTDKEMLTHLAGQGVPKQSKKRNR